MAEESARRSLTGDEITHYQQIVVALAETIQVIAAIDESA